MVGVSEGRRRLASSVVRWARRRSKRPSRARVRGSGRTDLHVESTVVGRVSVDEELTQAGLALVGDAVDLAVTFLVAAAGLRLARRRFALVTQDRQLTADGAGHRADEPGPGVINHADGAGQLEPVGLGRGAERDAAGPAASSAIAFSVHSRAPRAL